MIAVKRSKKIKKLTKDYLDLHQEPQSLIPGLNNIEFNHFFSTPYHACWMLVITIALSLCIYQCGERIFYYAEKPIKVQAEIVEETLADYPAIFITSTTTDESLIYTNEDKTSQPGNGWCGQSFYFYLDNRTPLLEVMNQINYTKMLQSVLFKKGSQHYYNKFKIQEIYTPFGMSTKLTNVDKLALGPGARLEIQRKPLANESLTVFSFILGVYFRAKQNNASFVITTNFHFAHIFKQNEFAFSTKKYMFLNTKTSPCVDVSHIEKCHTDCYLKEINRGNISCQLPFLPKTHDNQCLTNNLTCQYAREIAEIGWAVNPRYYCHCPRECHKIVVTSHYYFNDHYTNISNFYYFSNTILSLSEFFGYDFVSLLCDIGGFLSFYAGISCITTIDSITSSIKKRLHFSSYYYKQNTRFNKHVLHKIKKLNHWMKNNQNKTKKFKNMEKVKKIIIVLILICGCYYVFLRVMWYKEYPVYVIINLSEDRYVRVPNFVACSYPHEIIKEKEIILNYKNLSITNAEEVDILELLDYPSKYENNVNKLWDDTGEIDVFKMSQEVVESQIAKRGSFFKARFGNMSYLDTVFGKCIKIESDFIEYLSSNALVTLVYLRIDEQLDSYSRIFLTKANEDKINLKVQEIQPYNSVLNIKLIKQTFCRINTPRNPCSSLTEFNACEEKCLETKLKQRNIMCRLPYMNLTTSFCNTSEEAKITAKLYLDVYLNTDVNSDCNCNPLCNYTLYLSFAEYYQSVDTFNFVITNIELQNNYNEIFQQELLMPVVKLVCDVGSIFGFFLGVSILSCFELLQTFINAISKHK